MDDRRQSNRIDASNEGLRVINGVDGEQLGIVGNLSLGGMMLITTRRELYADGILQLQIDVPAEAGCGPIPLGVKVLWCTPANSPDAYWAGLETIDIGPNDRAALQQLLDYLTANR